MTIRLVGLVDFPLYVRAAPFAYAPQSHQSGNYLNRNRWVFNDRGLGVATPCRPGDRTDILLIGNSVVMGGNPYDQDAKLPSQLQVRMGMNCRVWPVAAGGWTTINELGYLEGNLDIVNAADFFVWQLVPGQLEGSNPWLGETVHPTHAPRWATAYVAKKAFSHLVEPSPVVADTSNDNLQHSFRRFDQMLQRLTVQRKDAIRGALVIYPARHQLAAARQGREWMGDRSEYMRLAATHGLVFLDVAASDRWTENLYRDRMHPTAQGNAMLADIVATALRTSMQTLGCS